MGSPAHDALMQLSCFVPSITPVGPSKVHCALTQYHQESVPKSLKRELSSLTAAADYKPIVDCFFALNQVLRPTELMRANCFRLMCFFLPLKRLCASSLVLKHQRNAPKARRAPRFVL